MEKEGQELGGREKIGKEWSTRGRKEKKKGT